MCLAVPVKVIELPAVGKARVEMNNVKLEVSTTLFPQVQVGDYVLIHAGFIIEKLTAAAALETMDILEKFKNLVGENEK